MKSHIECEKFDVNSEEDPLEIKTESQNIKSEIKGETEGSDSILDCIDIKHENDPVMIPIIKVESKVDKIEESLEDENSQDEKKNAEPDESNTMGAIYEFCNIYEKYYQEQECTGLVGQKRNRFSGIISSKSTTNMQTTDISHTNIKPFKPYKCTICHKPFLQKSSLIRHIRIHRNEKPFKCNICSKSFSQKSNLTRHIHTHTNEKPFKCTICSESFSQKSSLTRHTRTHTNEKPFKCSNCSKSFSRKSSLMKHIRKHIN